MQKGRMFKVFISAFFMFSFFVASLFFSLTDVNAATGDRLTPFSGYNSHIITAQQYGWDSQSTINIQLIDSLIGTDAWTIVEYENMFNQVPAYDEQWLLLEFNISYISGTDELAATDIIFSSENFYTTTGAKITPLSSASFSNNFDGYGQFDVSMYPGAEVKVIYGLLIKQSVGYPIFYITTGYDASGKAIKAWFSTDPNYKEPVEPLIPPQTPATIGATVVSESSINIYWTQSTSDSSYDVYRAENSSDVYTWVANTGSTTNYIDTNLSVGSTYFYKVQALRSAEGTLTVYSGFTSVAKVTLLMAVPINVNTSYPTATSSTVNWTSVSSANGYQVYRSLSATGTYSWIANAWTNSYTNIGLTTGTTYYYKVRAMNTTKVPTVYSAYSSTVAATPVIPLGIPSNLSVSTPTATSATLSWTSVSGANGYQVYRSLSATGTYSWIANAWTNSYTNSGLTTGTTYYYKIKAMNTTKVPTVYSVYSSTVAATPVIPLGIPSNLSVSAPTATSATLSWTSVSGANGYQVYRSSSASGTYSWIANSWTNAYTNTGLTTGTTYYYKIKAMNTTKVPTVYSLYSSTVAATPVIPLGIPSNLSVSTLTETSAKLTWTGVSGASGYQIYRSSSATGTYSWIANAWTNSYTNIGLTTGTTYYYKIKAMNSSTSPSTYSAYSNYVSCLAGS